jgi:hypothetical protein
MNRTLLTIALLGASAVTATGAYAQSAPLAGNGVSTSTMNYSAMPSADVPSPKGTGATWTPTAEEAYVKSAIHDAGYGAVSDLTRGSDGTWHARATKNNARVEVAFDRAGHITTN